MLLPAGQLTKIQGIWFDKRLRKQAVLVRRLMQLESSDFWSQNFANFALKISRILLYKLYKHWLIGSL